MNRELLEQAYEAFLNIVDEPSNADEVCSVMGKIKKELAKPEQDPVAWVNAVTGDLTLNDKSHTVSWAPLYE